MCFRKASRGSVGAAGIFGILKRGIEPALIPHSSLVEWLVSVANCAFAISLLDSPGPCLDFAVVSVSQEDGDFDSVGIKRRHGIRLLLRKFDERHPSLGDHDGAFERAGL